MLDDRRSSLAEFFQYLQLFICKSSVLEAVEVWDAPGIFSVFFCILALFTPSYYHGRRRKICWNFRSCRLWKILTSRFVYLLMFSEYVYSNSLFQKTCQKRFFDYHFLCRISYLNWIKSSLFIKLLTLYVFRKHPTAHLSKKSVLSKYLSWKIWICS